MNLAQLIDIKEKLAIGQPLTVGQVDFVLKCINACGLSDAKRDPNDYPRDHKPGAHWSTDQAWQIMDMMIRPGAISNIQRDMIAGMISGALIEARKLGASEGDAPGPTIHDPTIAAAIEAHEAAGLDRPSIAVSAPNYLGRIDNIWAFLSVDEGGEGICAAPLVPGMMSVPMIAADKARLVSLKPIARKMAKMFQKPVRLAKFTAREDIEIYQP